jgi:hypothetical protein
MTARFEKHGASDGRLPTDSIRVRAKYLPDGPEDAFPDPSTLFFQRAGDLLLP